MIINAVFDEPDVGDFRADFDVSTGTVDFEVTHDCGGITVVEFIAYSITNDRCRRLACRFRVRLSGPFVTTHRAYEQCAHLVGIGFLALRTCGQLFRHERDSPPGKKSQNTSGYEPLVAYQVGASRAQSAHFDSWSAETLPSHFCHSGPNVTRRTPRFLSS